MSCPITIGDAAVQVAGMAYEQASNRSGAAYATAMSALSDLGAFTLEPILFNTAFNFSGLLATPGTITPPEIDREGLVFQRPDAPPEPPNSQVSRPATAPAPTFTEEFPDLAWAGAPTLIGLTDPGAPPVVNLNPEMPLPPDFVLPAVPTLIELNIPEPPPISIPIFQGQRPVFDAPFPQENWDFTPEQYVSALLDQVRATVLDMLPGQPLPAAIAAIIRGRAYTAVDIEETRAVQQAWQDTAARGFDEPIGRTQARIAAARTEARDKRRQVVADVYIRDTETAIRAREFAVQQGLVLEGQLMQMHTAMQQLTLEAAKFALERAISILNARISVFNAQVAAYEADARVYRDLIQAELAKIELYRAQLEGERLRGEINQQRVQLYLAQLQGIQSLVDVYRARLQGVQTLVEIEQAKIEAFRTRVQVLATQIQGQAAQWDGFRARNEGNVARIRGFEAMAGVFDTRMRAWATGEQTQNDIARLDVDVERLRQEVHRGRLSTYEAELRAELGRVQAVATAAGAETGLFTAQVAQVEARQQSLNRNFQARVERERARTDVELKRADQMLEQLRHVTQLMVEVKRTIAQVGGQIGAAAQSAVNVSADVSSRTENSRSCNETHTFQD